MSAVSLKKHGLRADSLDCPAGGFHVVPEIAVVSAAATGGGRAACLACKQIVTLTRIEKEEDDG